MQPGSLINYTYRIAFTPNAEKRGATIESFKADAARAFPDAGWQIRDRNDAAPGIRRFVEQVTMFLTLVGLTALGVGGVGASEAISAFLDRKRFDIAILKSLGADGRLVFLIFFLQVMAIALAGHCCWAPPRRHRAVRCSPISMAMRCRCRPRWAFIPCRCCWRLAFGLVVGHRLCGAAAWPGPRHSARQPVARHRGAGPHAPAPDLYRALPPARPLWGSPA